MRLKKLELFGFKSFADKTEIIFDQGVTCVVGPNGCGKSNISDSIRWVLGERSAKLLRGSKMEDVIFNGTDFRKPLAMSEVSLTIDNSDRGLPIDYNEVTITRRLYRSGDSEYLINKTLCRLKDIQDLILDTGIGSNSYSMIEQGRIDYILNADAEERRFLIEEAAGISKFKVKKEEAIRKLERTEENRLRLNDIIHEVHKNIQYAERQAKKAERYREELEKLKKFEIQKSFLDMIQISKERETLQAEQQVLQDELQKIDQESKETRRAQETLNESLKEITERYRRTESERYAIQSKFEQNQQQLKFNQEKRIEIANRQGQIEQELKELQERIEKSKEEILSKKQEMESILQNRGEAQSQMQSSEEALKKVELQITNIKAQMDELKHKTFQAASDTSRIRNEFHKLQAFLETTQQQKVKKDAGAQRLKDEAGNWKNRQQSGEKDLQTILIQIEELAVRKTAELATRDGLQQAIETLQNEEDQAARSLHEHQTRLEILKEIEQAAKAKEEELLEQSADFNRDFVKTLREIFSVQPGFEWALESALESFSRSLIVEDLASAEKLIERIREKKTASMGIFVRGLQSENLTPSERLQNPAILHSLSEIITIKEGYENIFRGLFERCYVVREMPVSNFLQEFTGLSGSHKFITAGGLVLGPDNKVFCRNTALASEEDTFKRNAEIEKLSAEVSRYQSLAAEKETALTEKNFELQACLQQLTAIETSIVQAAVQKESLASAQKGTEERIHSFQQELELIYFESQELESQESDAAAKKSALEQELHAAEEQENQLRAHHESFLQQIAAADHERSSAMQHFAETRAHFASIDQRAKLLDESVKIMSEHQDRNTQRVSDLGHEAELLSQRQGQIAKEDAQLEKDQVQLEEVRREADIAVELVRQEKEKADEEFAALQNRFQELSLRQQELQGGLHQFEMKFMDFNYREKNISDRMLQAYKLNLEELNREEFLSDELVLETLAQQIETLKQKVESLGTVNLLAIEEYEELKQRYEFLMTQQKDLDDAREQLMETIRKINRTTKSLFEETFTNVQNQFQEYYQTLFRGGHAQLVLVDESNPLESGIDIMVRPPGKKPTHISLLSGGEKALTAIALLFALFKIKPSPFCVLDEVDAPLDEANVDRFLTVLQTFLTMSQFIIVTHNRKTIAMGDSLYGVTMQEAGVSKLVSVKVNKNSNAPSPVEAQAEPAANSGE